MSASPDFNDRLRRAVRNVPAPPDLEIRIGERLVSSRPRRALWMMPAAVAAAAAVALLVSYSQGDFRWTPASRESYIASVSYRVVSMMRIGLGDHISCAVFRKYPGHPPAPAEFKDDLGPQFAGLVDVVRDHVPREYRLMMAHRCSYHGRQFVHLTWKNGDHLLSLMITRRAPGERFDASGLLPALQESGIPIYQQGVQRFRISAFESGDDLVYLISDLPQRQNSAVMLAMAPGIRDFLEHAHS